MFFFTMQSRILGTVEFYADGPGEYIFVDLNGKSGTSGDQICEGGKLMGGCMSSPGTELGFEKRCRRWWRGYLRNRVD